MKRLFIFAMLFFGWSGFARANPNSALEQRIKRLEMQNKILRSEIRDIKEHLYKSDSVDSKTTDGENQPEATSELEPAATKFVNRSSTEIISPAPADEADIFSQMEMHDKSEAQDSDNALYKKARRLFKGAKYQMAQTEFQKLIKKYPASPLLGNSYYWLAESFFRSNKFEDAAFYYLKCYRDFPKSRKAADCLLQVSLCLSAMGKTEDACTMLDRLDENFPDRPAYSIKLAEDSRVKFGCITESAEDILEENTPEEKN